MEGEQKVKRSKKGRKKEKNQSGSEYVPGGIANFLGSASGHEEAPSESKRNALASFFQPSTTPKQNITPRVNHKASQGTPTVTSSKVQSEESEVGEKSVKKRKTKLEDEKSISDETFPEEGLTEGSKRRAEDDEDEFKKKRRKQEPMDPMVLSRTVFVGNLPVSISKKELKGLFKTYGTIESIRFRSMGVADPSVSKKVAAIKQDLNPKKTSFNAYIVFEEEEFAKAALASNGKVVNKHHMRVDIASNDKEHDMKRSLFVGNLPFNIDDEAVRTHFEEFGTIEGVRLIRDKATGVGKGFGYVLFEDSSSVQFALKKDGSKLKGRPLRVYRAVKKEKQKGQIDHSNQRSRFVPRRSKSKSRGGSGFQGQTGSRKPQFKNRMKRKQKPGGNKKGKQKR